MTVSARTRLGTRVRFVGHSFGYTNPPAHGEDGTVTYMPGFKPRTYLPGPGGGLLYVKWDHIGVMGVSPNDLEKVSGRGLGEDDEFPWVSLSYGTLPDKKVILGRVRGSYPMELVRSDADAIEECLMIVERKFAGKHDPFKEFPGRHGKHGYRFSPQGLYALIECVVENQDTVSDEERSYGPRRSEARDNAERALDLVASILQTLNIEWV